MSLSKKVVILGHFGVGKSSLLRRFIDNEFSEDYKVTIGVNILKKEVVEDGKAINLILWDIEGNDDMKKYRTSYLLGSAAFIYVFDASRPATYKDLKYNIDCLKEQFPQAIVQIIGNKIDLIDKRLIIKQLKDQEIDHSYFASAKTGHNVDHLFHELSKSLIEHASRT